MSRRETFESYLIKGGNATRGLCARMKLKGVIFRTVLACIEIRFIKNNGFQVSHMVAIIEGGVTAKVIIRSSSFT